MRITIVRALFARKTEFMSTYQQRRYYSAIFEDRHYAKLWAMSLLHGRTNLFPNGKHIPIRVEVFSLDCKYFGKITDAMPVMNVFKIIFGPKNLVTKLCVANRGDAALVNVYNYHRMPANGIACALMKYGPGAIIKRG